MCVKSTGLWLVMLAYRGLVCRVGIRKGCRYGPKVGGHWYGPKVGGRLYGKNSGNGGVICICSGDCGKE